MDRQNGLRVCFSDDAHTCTLSHLHRWCRHGGTNIVMRKAQDERLIRLSEHETYFDGQWSKAERKRISQA